MFFLLEMPRTVLADRGATQHTNTGDPEEETDRELTFSLDKLFNAFNVGLDCRAIAKLLFLGHTRSSHSLVLRWRKLSPKLVPTVALVLR